MIKIIQSKREKAINEIVNCIISKCRKLSQKVYKSRHEWELGIVQGTKSEQTKTKTKMEQA